KNCILGLFGLLFMLGFLIISFLSRGNENFEILFFVIALALEIFTLYYFSNIVKVKSIECLNNALAEIDASAFKPN
ncbi:hypothetical protein, partial [Providencia stuartii]|uniref:hypothetical protein n=1 Tax=Providencia stuartii TaxID=588 RepID=UPI002AA0C36C